MVERGTVVSTERSSSKMRRYLVLNGIFWTFCVVQLLFIRFVLPDFAGIYFFFGFLMISFSIVSFIDYLSECVGIGDEPQETDLQRYEQD